MQMKMKEIICVCKQCYFMHREFYLNRNMLGVISRLVCDVTKAHVNQQKFNIKKNYIQLSVVTLHQYEHNVYINDSWKIKEDSGKGL